MKKDTRIKKKLNELNIEFAPVVESYGKIAEDLIANVAFMSVTLEDLAKSVRENGTRIEYQHGKGQSGWCANPDVATYNTMSKNFANITKQLTELKDRLGPKDAGDGLDAFLSEG